MLVRPLIIAAYCYLGSGTVIPFDQPWGIAVWVVIFAVCIALAVLSFKYQDKVEKWLVEKFTKRKQKPAEEPAQSEEENSIASESDDNATQ